MRRNGCRVADVLSASARIFLARHQVGHLATADATGAPHVIPFCFALVDDTLYFVIDGKPKRKKGLAIKRMRNIAENPAVAVVVDDYDDDWTRLAYVLVRGRAEVVANEAVRGRALAALREKYPQYRAMNLDGPDHPVVAITAECAHFWRAIRD